MTTLPKQATILFYPAFENQQEMTDKMLRAAWYLSPLGEHLDQIIFVTKSPETELSECPIHLAPETRGIAAKFGKIKTRSGTDITLDELASAHFVFVHDETQRNELITLQKKNKFGFQIIRVDHENVQYADSFYLRFAEQFSSLFEQYRRIAEERIQRYLRPLIRDKCYLFGTGPNFSLTEGFDFSDGLVVACNSMAINEAVVDRLDPDVFVIADPIFHAGPSSYAGTFRESFVELLSRRSCPILVPMRDFHIYSTCFPTQICERLIPVEFKPATEGDGPNLNLLAAPYVATTSNILTLFQIPIAGTLANQIYISGCDGRPLTQNNYFWKHDKSVQINDQMALIRQAHPAFFKISYDDYYEKHINTLEAWLTSCEFAGKKVFNLTPSYIPALAKRTVPTLLSKLKSKRKPKVSVIIPLYNAAPYLEEAVKSIVDDKVDNVEILIIDDFSDDNSLDVAKQLAEQNSQITVIQNFHSKGVSGARNTGIDLSAGDYITFLDADDTLLPGSLRLRVQYMDAHPEIRIVHGIRKFMDSNSKLLGITVCSDKPITFSNMYGNPASFCTLMFHRSVLNELRFEEGLTNGEDWLALAKVLRKGHVSHAVPGGGATYRIHPKSAVMQDMLGHEAKLKEVIDWVYSDIPETEACPETIVKGISTPPKRDVLYERRLNKIIWCIFGGKVNAALSLAASTDFLAWMKAKPRNFDRMIDVAYVRFYSREVGTTASIPPDERQRITDVLQHLAKVGECKGLIETIHTKFFATSLGTVSIKEANRLYHERRYPEALAAYRKLRDLGGIHRHLDANIGACERKIRAG